MVVDLLKEASKIIAKAESILVFTGAGISKESGIPVFRGRNGLWEKYKPEELATPQAFERNPKLVWDWYRYRRNLIRKAKPNPAHYAISKLENLKEHFLLVTQNVDGLHQRAGSKKVVELHGNIFISLCTRCEKKFEEYEKDKGKDLPICKCGGILRPGVVWFGEPLPPNALDKAFLFAKETNCLIVVGTSGVVYPAAHIPYIAKESGAKVIEVNVEESGITPIADIFIKESATKALPQLI